ncbi:MAG: GTPase Era [Deltaproteobacteria bacterium]
MKAGIVAIIGRPNTGKSTLLNRILGEKVAIVSPTAQTTRHQVRGVLHEARGQIVFLDTPGLHTKKHAFDRAMVSVIQESMNGADILLHLVDATERVGEEEEMLLERLAAASAPVVLGLNKVDRSTTHLGDYIKAWEKRLGRPLAEAGRVTPVPLSALKGTNVDGLLAACFDLLPEGPPLYPEDVLTDLPRQLTVQEIVREKFLAILKEEIPFSMAVFAEEIIDRRPDLAVVKVAVLVERASQKAIVIGRRGELLKRVGTAARKELEEIYGKKFFLEMVVKVSPKWKQDHDLLRRIGYIV